MLYLVAARAGAGIVVFAIVSLFMGLGFTFYSGALEAWLVGALRSVGVDGDLDHVFARSQQVTGLAMLVGTTSGGFLGQLDLAVPFVARAVLLAGLLLVAGRTMHDLGFTPRALKLSNVGTELREQTRVGVAYGWNQPGLRLLMLAGLTRGAFLGWAFYAAQPYFLELLEDDAVWVVELLTRCCTRRSSIILGGSITTSIGLVVMGATDSFWVAVPFFLLVTGSLGVMSPVRQAYVHHVAASEAARPRRAPRGGRGRSDRGFAPPGRYLRGSGSAARHADRIPPA